MQPGRTSTVFWNEFVFPGRVDGTRYSERASFELVDEMLREQADIVAISRDRFHGSLANRNAYFREYAGFINQARTYLRAGRTVNDHTACLLYYYAAMNLAKAELLVGDPTIPIGYKWVHGLSHATADAKRAFKDSVSSQSDGVFPRLLRHRLGKSPTSSYVIAKVVRNIPELGSQSQAVGLGGSTTGQAFAWILGNGSQMWTAIAVLGASRPLSRIARARVSTDFRPVASVPGVAEKIIRDNFLAEFDFFESKELVDYGDGTGLTEAEAIRSASELVHRNREWLEYSGDGIPSFTVTGSMASARFEGLPPSLARYVAFFYGSSVVRYRPTLLSSAVDPGATYLFDALCRESVVPMMVDALIGLRSDMVHFTAGPGFVR